MFGDTIKRGLAGLYHYPRCQICVHNGDALLGKEIRGSGLATTNATSQADYEHGFSRTGLSALEPCSQGSSFALQKLQREIIKGMLSAIN